MRYVLFFLFILSMSFRCEKAVQMAKDWQKEQIKKRYGTIEPTKEDIQGWQEKIKEYEKIINQKVEAGSKAGLYYRKIGEAFSMMESYELCEENLRQAIHFGYAEPEVFFSLGLCQANLARTQNWSEKIVRRAEASFLKALNLDPEFTKAIFQLGLLYFYGFSKPNRYSVLNEIVVIERKTYRKKAIRLLREYQNKVPEDKKSYFALGGIYASLGETSKAIEQYNLVIALLKKLYPRQYSELSSYKNAVRNRDILLNRS